MPNETNARKKANKIMALLRQAKNLANEIYAEGLSETDELTQAIVVARREAGYLRSKFPIAEGESDT